MNSKSELSGLEIAVIGLACRFPGADHYSTFWNNLVQGTESVYFLSNEEIKELGINAELLNNKSYVRSKGAFITDKDKFDYSFWGYSLKEASVMDPQTRIMHECVWAALEDAACDPFAYAGKIGLIAGVAPNYSWLRSSESNSYAKDLGYFHTSTLVERDFSPLSIAYRLNLKGPCYSIFTTCSTSLVAIHQACRALLTGESNIMIAGGVAFSPDTMRGYVFQEGMILSSDGHCRAFDKKSSGTVKGEGAGFVVLKRLKNAIQDRDNIYAVIKGSAINNDGNRKTGFFAPGVDGQREVIETALRVSKVDPDSITYVEAHGTGTHIGDPIEIAGLTQAFKVNRKGFCAVGSVKTNIGHLDTAAGVAGFIKTTLCIKNKQLVPSLHYTEANPHINFSDTPFYVADRSKEWTGDVLRAGVSSFGIGGTNAHVILENYELPSGNMVNRPELFILSAHNQPALGRMKDALVSFVNRGNPDYNNIAYTLQVGRRNFPVRDFAVTDAMEEIAHLSELFGKNNIIEKELVLYLPDGKMTGFNVVSAFMQYNPALYRLFEQISSTVSIQCNCLVQELSNALSKEIAESIYSFIYQYAITKFLIALGAMSKRIIAFGTGRLAMYAINGVISVERAIDCILASENPAISTGKMDYPFSELTDNWENDLKGAVVMTIGKPDIQLSLKDTCYFLSLNEENARISFKQLLVYIGMVWKMGRNIDFNNFHSDSDVRKISMPTYPFEPVVIEIPAPREKQSGEEKNNNNWFYQLAWRKQPLIEDITKVREDRPTIVFKTNTDFISRIGEKITETGAEPLTLCLEKIDYELLSATIEKIESDELKVYIMLDLPDSKTNVLNESIENGLDLVFFKSLDIIRVFGKYSNKSVEVDFILNRAFDITGIEKINASLAVINAIVKIIPLEVPNVRCRIIDLNSNLFNDDSLRLLKQQINQPPSENMLAIRNETVWGRRLQRFAPRHIDANPSYIKEAGVYLVTGGFGGMGYIIAKYLLEQTSAKVILVGRTLLDDVKINKPSEYTSITSFGERAGYFSVDVADAVAMCRLAENIHESYGRVNGIFHTAGIADFGGIVERRSNESISKVLEPKVYGAINLLQLFDTDVLDFLVLFSSVGNILFKDKVGQIGYNAANEFLDALCNLSPKIISINWCDWKERGMTVDSILKKYGKNTGREIIRSLNVLTNDEGIHVMNAIVNAGSQNVIVYKEDLFSAGNTSLTVNGSGIATVLPVIDMVKKGLREYFLETFSLNIEDDNADFFELGADSLTVINSVSRINRLFDIQLSVNDFYDYPTLDQLANAIVEGKKNGFLKKTKQIAVKLGSGNKIIFAFPPAIGFGFLAYGEMAALLPECTIYAFNFLPDIDRIDKYVSFINEVTRDSTCILIGYSAGGTLAYEVAKSLEHKKVSDLIILDTYIYRMRYTRDRGARKILHDFFTQSRENYGEQTFHMVAPLMARFYFYVNNMVSDGSIETNVHLIKATDRDEEEAKNKVFAEQKRAAHEYKLWRDLTKGRYSEYNGYGSHHSMLTGTNYKRNADLVRQILL